MFVNDPTRKKIARLTVLRLAFSDEETAETLAALLTPYNGNGSVRLEVQDMMSLAITELAIWVDVVGTFWRLNTLASGMVRDEIVQALEILHGTDAGRSLLVYARGAYARAVREKGGAV